MRLRCKCVLEGRASCFIDREYAVQQREQKLEKKKQSLKLSAHKIGHDKTAIKRR